VEALYGTGRNGFKYRVAIEETQDLIELTVSNYLVGVFTRLSIGCNPIFAFEISDSPLKKKLKFILTSPVEVMA
jgi:hypothetical protein